MKLSKLSRVIVSVVLLLTLAVPAEAAIMCSPFGCLYMPDLFASSRQKKEAECERQYDAAIAVCNDMILARSRALCFARAAEAYGRCMKKAGGR